jgi:hypothetical protein
VDAIRGGNGGWIPVFSPTRNTAACHTIFDANGPVTITLLITVEEKTKS